MNIRALLRSKYNLIKHVEAVALFQIAILVSPITLSLLGIQTEAPFVIHAPLLVLILAGALLIVYSRDASWRPISLAGLGWAALLVLLMSIALGWILELRTDAFYTRAALLEVSAVLLALSIASVLLRRKEALGTPSEVLAESTNNSAALSLVLFWTLLAVNVHYLAVVILLLGTVLLALTVLLRLPGAIVPIYRSRRRFIWRRRKLKLPGNSDVT